MPKQMEYIKEFRDELNSMRRNSIFCDGTIISSDNKEYRIHRIVICGESEILSKYCLDALQDSTTSIYVGIRSDVLEVIIEALYLGEFPSNPAEFIAWTNLNEFFNAATQLKLANLKLLCVKFLDAQLSNYNCYIHNFYRQINSDPDDDLKKLTRKIIATNFSRVNNKWEFSGKDLVEILNDHKLNTKNEEEVVFIIEEWLRFNSEQKEEFLLNLCKCVRIDRLQSPEESFKQILEISGPTNRIRGTLKCPRVPLYKIFIIGGWHDFDALSDMEIFDPRNNAWISRRRQIPFRRSYHSLVSFDKVVYLFGGFDGESDFIYALGGYDGYERLSSAERYNAKQNMWDLLPPMKTERSDASACALGNLIIIAGGYTGLVMLKTAEAFDTSTRQWTEFKSMNSVRTGLSLICVSNELYAIGGFSGFERLSSIEKFSLKRKKWVTKNNSMITGRSNFGCASFSDTIYVFGGFDGASTIKKCECYNILTKVWTELPDLRLRRSAIGVCSFYAPEGSRAVKRVRLNNTKSKY